MVGSAVLDCSVWMRKSFPVIVDGGLRRWIAARTNYAFQLVMRRRAADLGFAKSPQYGAVHSDRQKDEVPI